jgi:hypothetical protein
VRDAAVTGWLEWLEWPPGSAVRRWGARRDVGGTPQRLTSVRPGGHGADVSAYVISRVSIRDSAAMSRYVDQAPATVARFGGRYLVRANTATALEGD